MSHLEWKTQTAWTNDNGAHIFPSLFLSEEVFKSDLWCCIQCIFIFFTNKDPKVGVTMLDMALVYVVFVVCLQFLILRLALAEGPAFGAFDLFRSP